MMEYAHDRTRFALPTSELYLLLLCDVLLGYALLGKGFAYLGFPPLYIGEITFLAGVVMFLRTGCLVASPTTLPSLLLMSAMVRVLLCTVPYVGVYGFDALRDSVIIMYGGMALFVIAILLEDARRIETAACAGGVSDVSFLDENFAIITDDNISFDGNVYRVPRLSQPGSLIWGHDATGWGGFRGKGLEQAGQLLSSEGTSAITPKQR